jgi:AcrR family transcriptional regulator
MGRPREFQRDDVLERAIRLFWDRGFADTGLADLEVATGVNKSGLYAEFKSKNGLFIASLDHYLETVIWLRELEDHPPGWANIERFIRTAFSTVEGQRGCFAINSLRDLAILPEAAGAVLARNNIRLRAAVVRNLMAEPAARDPAALADTIIIFFFGLAIQQTTRPSEAAFLKSVDDFLAIVRP